MSSARDTTDENRAPTEICDVSYSEIFVLDDVGSDPINPTSEEEEPEIVFIKETSCSPNEDNSESKAKGNVAVNSTIDEDEPEIIFSSATPIAPSPNLTLMAVETKEDNLEILAIRKSPDLTCPNLSCHSSQAVIDNTSIAETESLVMKDVSGLFCLDTTPEVAKDKPLGPRFRRV